MQSNPIDLEVEGTEHRFAPMNKLKFANSKLLLTKALEQMQGKEDWDQLGTLLAGYRKAGIVVRTHQMGKVVRRAGMAGHIYAVIECAKQAQETGLSFSNRENLLRTLSSINQKILGSGRDLAETKQAAKWMGIALDLASRQQIGFKLENTRLGRGLVLFTRASLVLAKQEAGQSVNEDMIALRDEVDVLKTLWADGATQDRIRGDMDRLGFERASNLGIGTTASVWALSQNVFALRMAEEVLGKETMGPLHGVDEEIHNYLTDVIRNEPVLSRPRCEEAYQRIFGKPFRY